MTLKVFEAFAGIGTQRMALDRLGIEHEVVAISEIDKFAIKSYEEIHGDTLNLGDITQIDTTDIPDHDLFTYSFPCQDISTAGLGKGLARESGTRSSLLWECERIIEAKRPKYLLMENVKALVNKKNKPHFLEWLDLLSDLGYTNYWQVLNAKDYGIPQNRERVFCVSILGDHEPYHFPEPFELELRLRDVLEPQVDEKFYLSEKYQERFKYDPKFTTDIERLGTTKMEHQKIGQREVVYGTNGVVGTLTATDYKQPKRIGIVENIKFESRRRVYSKDGVSPTITTFQGGNTEPKILDIKIGALRGLPTGENGKLEKQLEVNKVGTSNALTTVSHDNVVIEIKNNTKKGYIEARPGDGIDLAYPESTTRRGRVQNELAHTIDTSDHKGVINPDLSIRRLTPLECWRLMGVDDQDFYKAQSVNSNTQLYKQAGNAIVVDVLYYIFKELFASHVDCHETK